MALLDSRPLSLSQLRGLTGAEVSKLKRASISNTTQLLGRTQTRAAELKLARETRISPARMREAVNRADLVRLEGIEPAQADLFENAGVNSLKELSKRNPISLAKALQQYATSRPELGYRAPSADQVKQLVTKAGAVFADTPVEQRFNNAGEARAYGANAMHLYMDNILFGVHPEGAEFREKVLAHRNPAGVAVYKQRMHDAVEDFFAGPDATARETPTAYGWEGRWVDLYTEIAVRKAGGMERIFVELD